MAADAGIFQQYLTPVRAITDYRGDMDRQEQNALQLAAGRMADQSARQAVTDDQATRQAYAQGGGDSARTLNALQRAGLFKPAQMLQKNLLDGREVEAKIAHQGAQAAEANQKVASTRQEAIGQTLGALSKIEGGATSQHVTNAMQHLVDIGQISPEMAQKIIAGAPAEPTKMQGWLLQGQRAVLGVKDQLPKFQTIDTGGAVSAGVIDPATGAYTESQSVAKSQTPDSVASNERIRADSAAGRAVTMRGQNMVNARAKEAASNPDGLLPDDTVGLMAQQYLAGDTSVMQNLGRGAQGAQNIIKVRKEITRQSTEAGRGGADLAAQNAEYFGTKAGQRAAGTRIANVEMAASEAENLIPLARAASSEVVRSGLLPFGKAQMFMDSQMNNPAMRKFVAANNSLVNVYARAISPSGTPTVSDKEHAREMLMTAYDDPSYQATIDQMEKEITAARAAPKSVRKAFHDEVTKGHATESVPTGKPIVSAAKPSLDDIFGRKP